MSAPSTVHLLEASASRGARPLATVDAPSAAVGPPRRRRWLMRTIVIAAAIGVIIAARLTVLRPAPVPVTVVRVAAGRVEETVTNSKAGTVKSRRHADLSTEIGGRVVATPARAGGRVRQGDVLVQLADDELRAQLGLQTRTLDAARAEERRACTMADQAARELVRARALTAEGVASASTLDRAESEHRTAIAACDAARANVQRAAAAVRVAQIALTRTVLRAPFDGVVAEVHTEVGEWITPAPPGIPVPPVVQLIDPAAVYVSAALDEVDVAKMRLGLPTRVTLDALPGRVFSGHLTRIAPYVLDRVEEGRTFEVEVALDDTEAAAALTVGSSADLEIILRARDGVLRVPTYALIGDRAVLVVLDSRLVERPVRTGLRNWDAVEIVSGLTAGELVVVSLDRAEVRAGAMVRIESEVQR
jgi:HlyD family secretion protein